MGSESGETGTAVPQDDIDSQVSASPRGDASCSCTLEGAFTQIQSLQDTTHDQAVTIASHESRITQIMDILMQLREENRDIKMKSDRKCVISSLQPSRILGYNE